VTEVYDPVANTWTLLAPMKTAVTFAASVALNGKLYVFGGTHGTANVTTVQVYDPYANKWSNTTALPAALSGASGVVVDGLAFVEAGGASGGTTNQYLVISPSIP
jgi:N-acetylneuraminic acid mutarotase